MAGSRLKGPRVGRFDETLAVRQRVRVAARRRWHEADPEHAPVGRIAETIHIPSRSFAGFTKGARKGSARERIGCVGPVDIDGDLDEIVRFHRACGG